MSFYDTLRCLYHDPAYVVREHAETATTLAVVIGVLFMWGLA